MPDRFDPLRNCVALCCIVLAFPAVGSAGFIEDWIQGFADSEIVFERSGTNVPFLPLAYADFSLYQDTELRRPGESPLDFKLSTFSQGAVLPILTGPRDALFVGEWIGLSKFGAKNSDVDSFDAVSVGVPLGWLRQVDEYWQAAAFVMPLAHRANFDNSGWSYETLGGMFGRYQESDRLWWVAGFYFDVGQGDDVYLPYLGASWEFSDELTLSAVLPWPAVLYAPNRDTLFRFGASPAGASWTLNPDQDQILFSLGTWNLGVSGERRMYDNFWLGFEAGIGGLRSLRLEGGEWEGVEFDVAESPFLRFVVNYRPELP